MNDHIERRKKTINSLKDTIAEYEVSLKTIDDVLEVIKEHRETTKMEMDISIDSLTNLLIGAAND